MLKQWFNIVNYEMLINLQINSEEEFQLEFYVV